MENSNPEEQELDGDSQPIVGGIEREVLGKWTVLLRNLGGIIAVVVVSFMGVFNSYTIHVSVSQHDIWPSEMSMFIMVVGPVVVSWQFMNVSKTLTTIFGGASQFTKLRAKAAKFIDPGSDKN